MLNMLFRVRADIHTMVYKHDNEYIEGETAWIKYTWDGKYEKVDVEQLVQELLQGKKKTKRTNFYRG